MKLVKFCAFGLVLAIGFFGCKKKSDDDSDGAEDFDLFLEDLEFPEFNHQAKTITQTDAAGDDYTETELTYTADGRPEEKVHSAYVELFEALGHDETTVWAYDEDGHLETLTRYSDEKKKNIKSEETYSYTGDVATKIVRLTYTDDEVTQTYTRTFDEFGRELKTTTENVTALLDSEDVRSCKYVGDEYFAKKTCTTTVNDVKTKVQVYDYPKFKVTTTEFSGEDDEEGEDTYVATLLEGDVVIRNDYIAKKIVEVDDSDNTTTTKCESKDEDGETIVTCEGSTLTSGDVVTKEFSRTYKMTKHTFKKGSSSFAVLMPWALVSVDDTITSEEVTERVTVTRVYNDKDNETSYTTETETGASEDDLELTVKDVYKTTYDEDGARIKKYTKERKEGEGDISGATETVYEYKE